MQCRVREYRVELAVEGKALPGHDPGVDALRPRRGDHVGRGVDRHHFGARSDDLFGQHPVAAAEVEDALARLRVEQFEHRRSERRHEMRRLGIAPGLPILPRCDLHHQEALAASAWRRIAARVVRVVIISGSIRNSMIAARREASAVSKAGANSSVRATVAPKAP